MFLRFGRYLITLNKYHGPELVVRYLKAGQLAIQKAKAGQKLNSLRDLEPDVPLPRLAKCGLPAFIGLRDRRAILAQTGDKVLRVFLTFFSLYRVIDIEVKAKLNTITDPFKGDKKVLEQAQNYTLGFVRVKLRKFIKAPYAPDNGFLTIFKASPTNKLSFLGVFSDIHALMHYPKVYEALCRFLELTKNQRLMMLFE